MQILRLLKWNNYKAKTAEKSVVFLWLFGALCWTLIAVYGIVCLPKTRSKQYE